MRLENYVRERIIRKDMMELFKDIIEDNKNGMVLNQIKTQGLIH